MTEPTTPDKLDEILKKAWEHGYYSNNYPSDPNMTWFSDDKQELTNLIQTLEKKALTNGRRIQAEASSDKWDWYVEQGIQSEFDSFLIAQREAWRYEAAQLNTTTRSKE